MTKTAVRAVLVMLACMFYGQAQTFNPPTKEQFNAAGARPYQRFHAPDGPLKCEPIPANSPSYSDPRVKAALESPITHFSMQGAVVKIEFPGHAICTGILDGAKLREIKDETGKPRLFMDHCSVDDKEWANWTEITSPPQSTPSQATAPPHTIVVTQGAQQGSSDIDQLIKLKMLQQLLQDKPAAAAPTQATVDLSPLVEAEKERLKIEAEQLAVQKRMAGSLVWANRIGGANLVLNGVQTFTGIVTMQRVGKTNELLKDGFNGLRQEIASKQNPMITLTQTVGDVTSGSNPSVNNSTPTNIQNGQTQGQGTQVTANPQANGGSIAGSGNSQAAGGAGGAGALNPTLQGGQGGIGYGGQGGIGQGGYGGGGESSSSSSNQTSTTAGSNSSSTGASANSTGASATSGPSTSSSGSQSGATTGTVTANGTGNGGQATTGPVTSGSNAGSQSGSQSGATGGSSGASAGATGGQGGNAGANSGSSAGSTSGASNNNTANNNSGATAGAANNNTSNNSAGSSSGAAAGATNNNTPTTNNNNTSGSQSGAGAVSGSTSGATGTGTGSATQTTPPPAGGGGGN